jgi:hypothetical protein
MKEELSEEIKIVKEKLTIVSEDYLAIKRQLHGVSSEMKDRQRECEVL